MVEQPAPGGAVEGFRGRGFRVGGVDYPAGVLATASGARAWGPDRPDALTQAHFTELATAGLVIVGTGPTLRRPPQAALAALTERGVAVEFMDSRAAARTYNLLLAEGREVAAALLPL